MWPLKNKFHTHEIDTLNRLTVIFLDTAELRAKNRTGLNISFWKENVDRILEFNDRQVLNGLGTISNEQMERKVREIYTVFDSRRKALEAKLEDLNEIESLENKIKNSKG